MKYEEPGSVMRFPSEDSTAHIAGVLNFRVRDGIGCFISAMAARVLSCTIKFINVVSLHIDHFQVRGQYLKTYINDSSHK